MDDGSIIIIMEVPGSLHVWAGQMFNILNAKLRIGQEKAIV